jgi:hypothetical protein
MADPKKTVIAHVAKPDPKPKAEAKPVVAKAGGEAPALCDVSKCSVVKIKSATCSLKTLYVARNMRPELLKFAADVGPDCNLVIACADGWTFISAE